MKSESNPSQKGDEKYARVIQHFACLLKRLRSEKGLTQHDLCDRSGLSLRTISDMESGIRQPTLITLFKLAEGLDIEVLTLLGRLDLTNESVGLLSMTN